MKKSCSDKESKVITTKNAEDVLNDKEESLTEEQVLINKKLCESGVDSEGLGWLEKRNIYKTITVSLNSCGSEKPQRTSPRFGKAKWAENSFENSTREDSLINFDNEKTAKQNKFNSETNNTPKSPVLFSSNGRKNPDSNLKLNNKRNYHNDAEVNGESPKSSKKVHYIKIQIEGETKEENNISAEETKGVICSKKRSSSVETETVDAAKKLKMDESNNGVPSEDENPLLVELDIQKKKQNTPFILRDVKSIVHECDYRNKKWKETFAKYNCPARWGIPIVKNCEKWDGRRIPTQLLHRYQKYLVSNNLTNSIFFPKTQINSDDNKLSSDLISSQSSTNSECKEESENECKDISEGSFLEDESRRTALENNLNASTSNSNGRMVLRNRNQKQTVVDEKLEEEECSSDDSDEWFSKQKSNKKQKINSKKKKSAIQSKQLVIKLEKCDINKKNENEEIRKNGNNLYSGGSIVGTNQIDNSKTEPDPDTMVCPICSLRFKKQLIESHATECASKTYKD